MNVLSNHAINMTLVLYGTEWSFEKQIDRAQREVSGDRSILLGDVFWEAIEKQTTGLGEDFEWSYI